MGLKEADDDALYTVVFVDPDAPSKEEPDERCFLHWAFGNIKVRGRKGAGFGRRKAPVWATYRKVANQ